jgi:hypothetical protein
MASKAANERRAAAQNDDSGAATAPPVPPPVNNDDELVVIQHPDKTRLQVTRANFNKSYAGDGFVITGEPVYTIEMMRAQGALVDDRSDSED